MAVKNVELFKLGVLEVYSTFRDISLDSLEESEADALEQKTYSLADKVFNIMQAGISLKPSMVEIIGERHLSNIQSCLVYVLDKDKIQSRSTLTLLQSVDPTTEALIYKVANFLLPELREDNNSAVRAVINSYDDCDLAVLSAAMAVDM